MSTSPEPPHGDKRSGQGKDGGQPTGNRHPTTAGQYFREVEQKYSRIFQTERSLQRIMKSPVSEIYSGSTAMQRLAGNSGWGITSSKRFGMLDITSSTIARMNSIQATSQLWGSSIASLVVERFRITFPPHIRDWLPPEALRLATSLQDLLPDNLWELEEEQWYRLLDISSEDRLSVAWAPSHEVIVSLIEAPGTAGRRNILRDQENQILLDLKESLSRVGHPAIEELASFAARTADCAGDGHTEAATALAVNVLDSALEKYESHIYTQLKIRPQDIKRRGQRAHLANQIAQSVPADGDREIAFTSGSLTFLMATYGLNGAFDTYRWPDPPDPKFNRNMLAHRVGDDTYQPHFALHALLLTNALLRWLDIQVPREPGSSDE